MLYSLFNLGVWWVKVVKTALPLGKKPDTGCLVGLLGMVRKMSPIGIRSPDCPAHSKSLYRLSYLSLLVQYVFLIIKTNNMHTQSKYIYIYMCVCVCVLQIGRSLLRFQMVPLKIFIDIKSFR